MREEKNYGGFQMIESNTIQVLNQALRECIDFEKEFGKPISNFSVNMRVFAISRIAMALLEYKNNMHKGINKAYKNNMHKEINKAR